MTRSPIKSLRIATDLRPELLGGGLDLASNHSNPPGTNPNEGGSESLSYRQRRRSFTPKNLELQGRSGSHFATASRLNEIAEQIDDASFGSINADVHLHSASQKNIGQGRLMSAHEPKSSQPQTLQL